MTNSNSIIKQHSFLFILLLLTFIVHSLVAMIPPLQGDEAYFWEWSRHLSLGYYSHPPMTGWLIAIITAIFETSKYTVRLTSILLHLVALIYVYRLSLEVTNNLKIANTSVLMMALMPISLIFGTGITTDSSLITFYTMSVYYTRRAIIESHKPSWYLAGIFCGGMLLSKFMAILFFPGVFLFLLLNKTYRYLFTTKEPYLAAVLALVLFSPFVYWNSQNEWLTVQFNFFVRQQEQHISWEKPFIYILGQMIAAIPILWYILIHFLVKNFRLFSKISTQNEHLTGKQQPSLLFISYVVGFPLAFFLLISIKVRIGAHWAAIIYPASAVLISHWFYQLNDQFNDIIQRKKTYISSLIMAAAILTFTIWALVNPKSIFPEKMVYTESVNHDQPRLSHYYGWEEIGQHISQLEKIWSAKPEGFFFTSKDYSLASTLAFYAPSHPQFYLMNFPRDGIHGKDFLIWEKGNKPLGANTIYVTDTRDSYQNRISGFFKKTKEMPPFIIKDKSGRILRIFYLTIGYHYLGGEPDNLSIF